MCGKSSLFERKYPLETKIVTTAEDSMYSSSASMDCRSSTSRKTEAPGNMILSWRLIVAHWSCPVPQICERNMCHLCPFASGRSGGALVDCSRIVGMRAASKICCAAIAAAIAIAIRIEPIMPTVTSEISKVYLSRSCSESMESI